MTKRKAPTMQKEPLVAWKKLDPMDRWRLRQQRDASITKVHAALYPTNYANPRLWDRVPWPQRWQAFEAWERTTKLYRLTNETR